MSIQQKFLTVILGIVFVPAVIVNVAVFHGVAESMRGVVVVLWAAASLILVMAAWVMARRMARPILDMAEIATRVAQDNGEGGALRLRSWQVDYASRDEIGSLAQNFNAMIRNLQEQRAKLVERAYVDSILESMTDALIVTGAGGTIKMANQAAWDLLGYDGNELLGQNAGRVIRDKATLGDFFISEDFKAFLREGSVRQLDLVYVTKGGEQIPVSFSGSVIYKKDGRLASSIHREAAVDNPDRSVGIVGVARDMRMIESLIADLETSRRKTEEWSHTLERRVEERTRDLSQEQEAMLNILEDLAASKGDLEKSNRAIRNVKEEIEAFSRTLEERVRERTFELSVLYEISNAISYTLDYQTLLKLIMESIYRVVPYDICASLLLDGRTVNITAKLSCQGNASLVEGVKDKLIGAASMLTGQDFSDREVHEDVIQPVVSMSEPSPAGGEGGVENSNQGVGKEQPRDKIRSFFNIPFIVHGRILGMINVSSCEEAVFNESNVRLMYTIVHQGSTALDRLRSVIRAEKSKMERMVASMAEGVIMVDERGEVIVLNPKARQMLGFLPDEGISGAAIHRKMRIMGFDKAIEECRTGKEAVTRETVIPQQEGGLYVHSDISPVKDEEGKIIGIVAILIDVTREKQVDKLKDEFVSTVSHELRTPLAITTEGINLILDGIAGPVNEQQKELLGTSRDNLSRLNTIINDLLDISKIEAGKVTLRHGLMDLRALLVHLGDVYQKTLETKKQTMALKLPESPCLIYADRDKIIQILTNLLNNAHKFTPEGGRIAMDLSVRPGDVLCAVRDNGVGIAAEDIPKVFNKFEQFGRTYGPGIKGTGLGLSIVKSLVEIHGGKIWVESQAGQGCAFFFTIPTYETVRARFNAEVGRILEEAGTQKQCVSFLVVHVKNSDVIQSRYGERMLIDIISHLCDITATIISRASDRFILYDAQTIYAALPWTNRAGALAIMKRFKGALAECVLPIEDKGDLEVQFGLATYPFEGRSPEALAQAAIHNMSRKKRVLVVDDNPDIFSLLQVDLKNDAVELEAAADGQEALLKAQDNPPDLIVLDIMLPRMNGYEVLGRLKHDARTASIPVVVLTAKEKGEVEREYGGLGDIPVVSKTGGFEKLEQIVKELL